MIRVKDKWFHIVKDALLLYKNRDATKEWKVKKSKNKYIKIKVWDEDDFKISDKELRVRFLKFVEEIHTNDKVGF